MRIMKKAMSLLAAGSIALSLAACGGSAGSSSGASSASGDGQSSGGKGEPVVLEWYLGGTPQEKQDAVFAEINKILEEKLNIRVNFHFIDYGNYGQQMQMLMTSGEKIDMMFTSNWTNDFYTDVSKGAYQEIDMDMVKEYAPYIMQEVPEGAWSASIVNGKQYAIPNVQVLARWPAIVLQKQYVDKYNFDTSSPKELSDFTELLEQIVKNEPGIYATDICKNKNPIDFYKSAMRLEDFSNSNPLGIRIDDPNLEIVNIYETEEMREFLELMRDWYNRGIIRKDAASVTDVSAEMASAKIASMFASNNPDMVANQAATMGLKPEDLVVIPLSDPYLSTSTVVASMTAINAQSEHAKECLMVLNEFFNTEDTRVQNLLCFGIEGVNYEKVEDDLIKLLPNTGYTESSGWAHGTLFNCYRVDPNQPAWRPAGPDINNNAEVSPMMGFSFDPTSVKNELTQVAAVMDEFIPTLVTGSADVETTLSELNAKLDQAGIDNLQAEMQRQIDEWKANK